MDMDLEEIYKRFPTHSHCIAYLEKVCWNGVPRCPNCRAQRSTPRPGEQRHHCNACNTSFSVTVRTMFHQSHTPLQKWFLSVSLVLDAKRKISVRDLADAIQVNRNTAWRIVKRVRWGIQVPEDRKLLQAVIEWEGS